MTSAIITHLESTSAPQATTSSARAVRATVLMTACLVVPAALLLLTPFAMLGLAAVEQPEVLATLSDRPGLAAQLGLALIISLMFCALPFRLRTAEPEMVEAPASAEAPIQPQAAPVIALSPRDEPPESHPLAA